MKIYKYLIGLISLSMLSACSDWLDIQPQDTTEDDQLFETGEGFRNALNGVYRQMAGSSMYGKELTWGALDAMANYYTPSTGTNEYYFSRYQYTGSYAYPVIQSFWSTAYNCIANCNNLIQRTQKEPVTTFMKGADEKNVILGEALALRAILHFDIMRLFASAQMNDPVKQIPFVDVYPCTFKEYGTNEEVSDLIIKDLKQAKELLAKFDVPRISWMMSDVRWKNDYQRLLSSSSEVEVPKDLFFAYRGYRLNYYAICGMLARVYLYKGMYEEAFRETEIVVNAVAEKYQEYIFDFTNSRDMADGNSKLYNEIIFALSNQRMEEDYRTYRSGSEKLHLSNWSPLNGWFAGDANDIRYKLLVEEGWDYYSSKYLPAEGTLKKFAVDIIPMLRLGEMYYIRAEYYNHLSLAENLEPKAKEALQKQALEEFAKVRRGHGCNQEYVSTSGGDAWFNRELLNEARREFIGEGQLFFYYKRLGEKVPGMGDTKNFVLPYPQNEAL